MLPPELEVMKKSARQDTLIAVIFLIVSVASVIIAIIALITL